MQKLIVKATPIINQLQMVKQLFLYYYLFGYLCIKYSKNYIHLIITLKEIV